MFKMKTSTPQNISKVIKMGKSWMSMSTDPMHDREHVVSVGRIAAKIYSEMKLRHYPGIRTISPEHVKIMIWWHDCYKATIEKDSFWKTWVSNFVEGRKSKEIFQQQTKSLLTHDELSTIGTAIEHHAGLFPIMKYLLTGRAISPLHKIILEADAWDMLNPNRFIRCYTETRKSGVRILLYFDILQTILIPFYFKTKTTRRNMWRRLDKFWGTWFWRKWGVLRIWFERMHEAMY